MSIYRITYCTLQLSVSRTVTLNSPPTKGARYGFGEAMFGSEDVSDAGEVVEYIFSMVKSGSNLKVSPGVPWPINSSSQLLFITYT